MKKHKLEDQIANLEISVDNWKSGFIAILIAFILLGLWAVFQIHNESHSHTEIRYVVQ